MPLTIRSQIEYEERLDYKEHWIEDGNQATRVLDVAWGDRGIFREDLLGAVSRQGSNVHRRLPEPHPLYDWMYAAEMNLVQGYSDHGEDGNGLVDFDRAVYQVTYKAPTYVVLPDDAVSGSGGELNRYVTRKYKFTVENMMVPGGGFFTVDDATKANRIPIFEVGVRTVGTLEMQYTWHMLPELPINRWRTCLGRVNTSEWEGYPAETVLAVGVEVRPYYSADGDYVYDITYLFMVRMEGTWNSVPRPDGTWLEITDDGQSTGSNPYQTADLNLLFQLDA